MGNRRQPPRSRGILEYVKFLLILLSFPWAFSELISTGVGVVRGQVVTSREVQIQHLIEIALTESSPKDKLKTPAIDSKAFAQSVQDVLLEYVVSLEARNFNLVEVSEEEVARTEKKVAAILKGSSAWKELRVSSDEFTEGLRRKLQAKKFIQFRAQSSVLPVTDGEAQKYFNENRLKFGNLPFENFKENIKSYLSRAQVERRLKDWYDLLLSKYQVKNLISEI